MEYIPTKSGAMPPESRARIQSAPRRSCRVFSARGFALAGLVWLAAMTQCIAIAAPPVPAAVALTPQDGPEPLVITLSREPHTIHNFTLSEPDRLVLDITPANLPGNKRNLPASHPLISGIRAAQFDADTVRVVLDIKSPVACRIATRPAADGRPFALVISLPDPPTPGLTVPVTTGAIHTQPGGTAPGEAPEHTPDTAGTGEAASPKTVLRFDAPSPAREGTTGAGTQAATSANTGSHSRLGSLDLSGFLQSKAAQQLHESGYPEQARMFRGTAHMEGKWTPSPFGEGGEATSTYLLGSLRAGYLGFGPDPSSDDQDLELWEGYLYHSALGWDMRLGRQIVRWGKADQVSPVDNVNPEDMREFLLPALEDRKLPNWMARMRLFPLEGQVTIEGLFISVFEENEFDWTGNTWAMLGTDPGNLHIHEDKPGKGLDNADWGGRAAVTVAGWDLAASYLHATEKSPRLRFDPMALSGPTLHADYDRQDIYGFEFETTLGKFGFRGEGAYFDRQSLPTESLDTVSKRVLQYVLGIDYIGEQEWYVNVQFSQKHIFEYDHDILFSGEDNFFLYGEINKEFWRGNIMLKLSYATSIDDGGSFVTPEMILSYFDNTELTMGTNVFLGPEDSFFGRYQDRDQIFLKVTHYF